MIKRLLKNYFLLMFIAVTVNCAYSQDTLKQSLNTEPKNVWGVNVQYSESGMGIGAIIYKRLSNVTDLFGSISIGGVTDNREFEYFDYYGNSYIVGKLNRVYKIPLEIGIEHFLFSNSLEGTFKPNITAGITPALLLTDPYNRNFFSALKYIQPGFAFGGFIGAGLDYRESNFVAITFNIKYLYMPVIGREIMSLQDKPIKDVGGLNISIGVNFLK
jgi:outer membrane protein W